MKINIVIKQVGEFPHIFKLKYTFVDTFEEIRKIDKYCIDEHTFAFIKALEANENFFKAVKEIRKASSLPEEGYDLFEKGAAKRYGIEVKGLPPTELLSRIDPKLLKKLSDDFRVPPILKSALAEIVLMNYVFLPLPKIYVDRPYKLLPKQNSFNVKIVLEGEVSKQQVKDFLDENWHEISQGFKDIKNNKGIYISSRDLKIYHLKKNDNLTYRQIADILEKEDNLYVNEGAIKEAYHRAEDKIHSLNKK